MDVHLASLLSKELSLQLYDGAGVVRLAQGEFMCPLCKTLSNTLVPVLPPLPGPDDKEVAQTELEAVRARRQALAVDFSFKVALHHPVTQDRVKRGCWLLELVKHNLYSAEVATRKELGPDVADVFGERLGAQQLRDEQTAYHVMQVALAFLAHPDHRAWHTGSSWGRLALALLPVGAEKPCPDKEALSVHVMAADPVNVLLQCIGSATDEFGRVDTGAAQSALRVCYLLQLMRMSKDMWTVTGMLR
jgi:hypothetical protein